jgi:hypothetical protein
MYGERKMSLWSTSKDQKQVHSPRKKDEDTYEVRVEGRGKEGLVSFAKFKTGSWCFLGLVP